MTSAVARSRRHLVLTLVVLLVAALGGLVTSAAVAGGSTLPTRMVITNVHSDLSATAGTTGALPNVIVGVGDTLYFTVEFSDANGPQVFSSDTPLKISSTSGSPIPATATAPAGVDHVDLQVHFDAAANNVGLVVTVARGPARGLTSDPMSADARFDVLTDTKSAGASSGSSFTDGIGGDDGHCGNATTTDKVCGLAVLPSGAGSDVFFSTGLCDSTYKCNSKGALVQTLFADAGLYGQANPATLIVKCDKSLCGTGQISRVVLNFTTAGNGALTENAGACPAKNTLGTDLKPCIDYVQTKRDGSGDTILYLLFAQDMRIGIG